MIKDGKVCCDKCGAAADFDMSNKQARDAAGWVSIFVSKDEQGRKSFSHICRSCRKSSGTSEAAAKKKALDEIMVKPDHDNETKVELLEYPDDAAWLEVKRRALVTVGLNPKDTPDMEWRKAILKAKHSPIRYLRFSFRITCPYWVSVHLCRHIHAQPYVRSQRNDRQSKYDRNKAPQDELVTMIWDMNAEELMTICEKRLCNQASKETQRVAALMKGLTQLRCPEFKGLLKPPCEKYGKCFEIFPCEKRF